MYDILIIGAGPAGYVAAIKAAKKGKSVALIEKGEIGGTCLNRGCIPTKTFFYSAKKYFDIKNSHKFGISFESLSFDYEKMLKRKNLVVGSLKNGLEGLIRRNKIKIIKGKASFLSKNEVLVENEKIKASYIIIAT